MSVTAKALVESKLLPSTVATQYTASNGKTIIDKMSVMNITSPAAASIVYIYIVPAGGSTATSNLFVQKTLQGQETYTFPEVVGHTLEAGDFIAAYSSVASSVSFRASGREIT